VSGGPPAGTISPGCAGARQLSTATCLALESTSKGPTRTACTGGGGKAASFDFWPRLFRVRLLLRLRLRFRLGLRLLLGDAEELLLLFLRDGLRLLLRLFRLEVAPRFDADWRFCFFGGALLDGGSAACEDPCGLTAYRSQQLWQYQRLSERSTLPFASNFRHKKHIRFSPLKDIQHCSQYHCKLSGSKWPNSLNL